MNIQTVLPRILRRRVARSSWTFESADHVRFTLEALEPRVLLSGTPLAILPLGDSITAGTPGYDTYRRPLHQMLTGAGYDVDFIGSQSGVTLNNDFDLDHEGHGGWRADQLINGRSTQPERGKLSDWLATYTPDVVLLHIGTNDFGQGQSVSSTLTDVGNIIGVLRADNSNVTIFVAQIIPANDGRNASIQEFNSALPAYLAAIDTPQSRIIVVDQYTGFNVNTDLYDHVHPNAAGELKIATNFFNAIHSQYGPTAPGGVIFSQTSGLITSEDGQQAQFDVKLTKAPSANVTFNLSVSHPGEVALSTTSLVFSSTNWNTFQTVTVTGLDDDLEDGNIAYTIVTSPIISADATFHGFDPADITGINLDNDWVVPLDEYGNTRATATTIDPMVGTTTRVIQSHIGGSDDPEDWIRIKFDPTVTIKVKLTGLTANVDIELWSSKPSAGSYNTGTADEEFTRSISGGFYYIRVFSVDGILTPYTLTVMQWPQGGQPPEEPGDPGDPGDPGVVPGSVIVTPTSGLVTSEDGQQATFNVSLSKAPTANVTINLSVSHPGEVMLSTTSLVFTPANWNVAQTVTVTGLNDDVVDGDVAYTIFTAPAISDDPAFHGVNPPDITGINLDNDGSSPPPPAGEDAFGNTRATATTIDPMIGTTTRVIQSHIGGSDDPEDWIRIKFDPKVTIKVTLTGLSADANIELWAKNPSAGSYNTGTADEEFTRSISGGYYYIRVFSADGILTPYTLTISQWPQAG